MVEELDSRLKRCPCCGGETVLPPVGDLLASPVPEPAESFFLQAEHREERGLSPGQRAGVLVPHPARA